MRPAENIKRLIKNAIIKINPQVKKSALKELINELEKSKITGLAGTKPNIWSIVARSRIAQISVAAVIIIAVSFFQIARNHDNQTMNHIKAQIKTPAETLTLVSINAAYHKGGLEAVEKDYEQVYEKMVPWPRRVTISELFEELNGS